MSKFVNKRSSAAFQLSPVAAGCALFVAALAQPAYAQSTATAAEADAPQMATVTVSGIRRGIEGAISVKKDATSIVEAISAEDIGKLPDVSIAESISRLPGLAAQRVAGRAQVISVRGLSPDFSTTLLNGREQVSTGDNRSVEFDQYPSELMAGVTIYKTPDAGLVGQGLSGTIDMQTVRPLSFGSRTVALNARGEHNSLGGIAGASANGNRFSASYIDQFANRTVGIALGFAHLESPILDHETGMYEPWKTDSRPGIPSGTYITDGIKAVATSGTNKRDGFMGVLQYRPNKQWTSILDIYASEFKQEQTNNQLEVNLGNYNGGYTPGLNYVNPVFNGNSLAGGTATGVFPLVRGMYNKRKDEIHAAGWSNEFRFKDWSLFADVNYSQAKRDELSLENNLQHNPLPGTQFLDSLGLKYASGGFPTITTGLNYSDPTQLYVRNTIYGSGYGKVPHVEDELKGFKLVASLPVPDMMEKLFSGVDVGVNYADRSKKRRQPEGPITLANDQFTVPSNLQYAPVDLSFAGVGTIPAWNVPGVVASGMVFHPVDNLSYLVTKAWDVQEKVTTSFVKANIEADMGDVSVRGNVGVQVQRTNQSSQSRYVDNSTGTTQIKPVDEGKTYTDVLPSLNLAFGFDHQQTVRFGMAKQLARPRVDQLSSAFQMDYDKTNFRLTANGGNAKLDPWRANAFDISYEKYFDKKAYLAAAGFYKKLTSYIYTQTKDYDFSSFIPPGYVFSKELGAINTATGPFSAPYNGQGGTLKGLEFSGSLPLELVTKSLDGFGVQASATFSTSDIKIEDPSSSIGSNIPLPGLSKRVTNLTAYYEKNGFETRISSRKRSDYVGEISNFANSRTLRYVVGDNVVDFQVGYTFNEGTYKGLGLLLQVNNLTNAAYETYTGTRNQQLEYQKYGRTILMGANYKF
ncbi:TonB-dependent receptor [Duganella sp. FT3S]|uniref:TonB-dependent receptor n=1 Tax=Rugamonas fusca TaxID=2758568 RepID=A0A7W2EMT5_9BURK|nr:TonB-dependent receptor [Rugamonas fusca]MBA5608798.1 TonB-dependent receptor [Rugamonas fusca]